jgi:formylglycine-generating enzyme required for sulfatase activity
MSERQSYPAQKQARASVLVAAAAQMLLWVILVLAMKQPAHGQSGAANQAATPSPAANASLTATLEAPQPAPTALPLSPLRLLPAEELLSGAPVYNPVNLRAVARAIVRITGCQSERACAAAGSGVLIHASGVILTAWHVTVADPGPADAPNLAAPPLAFFKVETTEELGRGVELRYRARLIASDPVQDLALLRIYWDEVAQRAVLVDGLNNLPHLSLRDPSEEELTAWYEAQNEFDVLGYALGDNNLSSIADTISRLDLVNFELGLQRQLSKGFSGGPLLIQDERYEVLGVVIRRSGDLGERGVIRTLNSAQGLTWQPEAVQVWGEEFAATLEDGQGQPQLHFALQTHLLDFVGRRGQLMIHAINSTTGEPWLPDDPAQLTVTFSAQRLVERQPLTLTLSLAGVTTPLDRLLFKPFLWEEDEARLLWQSDRWYRLGTPAAPASTPTPIAPADLAATQTVAAQLIAAAVAATLTALPTATPVVTVMPDLAASATAQAQLIDAAVAATLTALPTATATPRPTSTPTPTATATPAEPAAGATRTNRKDGAVYVYVPAGEFVMGSTDAQIEDAFELCQQYNKDCNRDFFTREAPQHTVTLAGFWIMQSEVTNAQYQQCVEEGVCSQPKNEIWDKPENAQHPVTHVDWSQANAYARWAGGQLPSEAQWEKAARGDDGRIYPWGDDWQGDRLNFCDKNCAFAWKDDGADDGYAETAPVGRYPAGASPYGAYDMAGNVWEWTSTLFQPYPYDAEDGREDATASGNRTLRGGSWDVQRGRVRAPVRADFAPDNSFNSVGFRVVRSVSPGF